MISESEINHRFFVLGVLAAAIIPRHVITNQQHDNKCWLNTRIGGGMLSHNFRKLLLVIAMVNLFRLFLSNDLPPEDSSSKRSQLGSDVLGILEVTLLTFLCCASFSISFPIGTSRLPCALRLSSAFSAWLCPAKCTQTFGRSRRSPTPCLARRSSVP